MNMATISRLGTWLVIAGGILASPVRSAVSPAPDVHDVGSVTDGQGVSGPWHQADEPQTVPLTDRSNATGGAFDDIRKLAWEMPRIDTHSHMGSDIGDGVAALPADGPVPDVAHFRSIAEGVRVLYDVDPGPLLRRDAPAAIFEKAAALRGSGTRHALEVALDAEHITVQLAFCGPQPQEARFLTDMAPRVKLLAYIDPLIIGASNTFCPDRPFGTFNYYDLLAGQIRPLDNFDDYLAGIDAQVDAWPGQGVVGMKTALAYTIGLTFTDPTLDQAQAAFAKKRDMTQAEATLVQHAAFRHALLACQRNKLPLVVHTGFQIWGHADLRQSNPMLLHSLLVDPRYQELTFVLLHGGNPYVGETTYLAKMFPNVVIDFTWISWMSRARFRQALREWLEVVPHDRLCWGSDSSTPETIVGNGRCTRTKSPGSCWKCSARECSTSGPPEPFSRTATRRLLPASSNLN